MVLDAVQNGEDAMWLPSREDVIDYLKNSPDLPADAIFAPLDQDIPLGKKRVFVYAAPSQSNQGRLWGMIAHEIPKGSYVVLYTTKKFPSRLRSDFKEFMDYQDWRYEECFEIVNLSTQGITIQAPDERPWQFIGVIPQIHNDEHDTLRAYNQVIKPEDFKKLLP